VIVDAHRHVIVAELTAGTVPGEWRQRALRGGQLTSVVAEFTDVAAMLGQAGAGGVDHLLLSPWISLVPVEAPLAEAELICQIQNDALVAAAARERVSAVGAVALQDPVVAARQLEDLLAAGLSGAEIPASVAGRYLGDDFFLPFWEAAAGTGALVFVHPATHGFGLPALDSYYLWNSVGNPLETAVTGAHIVMAGVLERYPGLRVLLAHGGGALPVVRGRLRRAFEARPEARARCAAGPDESLRRFYYDTVTHDPALLAALVAYAGAGQVLLGSDQPFDMGTNRPVDEVRALALPGEDEDAILGLNAARLFIPDP
jgi:aminocarboxymuconate-semialdehyde decarboxylase